MLRRVQIKELSDVLSSLSLSTDVDMLNVLGEVSKVGAFRLKNEGGLRIDLDKVIAYLAPMDWRHERREHALSGVTDPKERVEEVFGLYYEYNDPMIEAVWVNHQDLVFIGFNTIFVAKIKENSVSARWDSPISVVGTGSYRIDKVYMFKKGKCFGPDKDDYDPVFFGNLIQFKFNDLLEWDHPDVTTVFRHNIQLPSYVEDEEEDFAVYPSWGLLFQTSVGQCFTKSHERLLDAERDAWIDLEIERDNVIGVMFEYSRDYYERRYSVTEADELSDVAKERILENTNDRNGTNFKHLRVSEHTKPQELEERAFLFLTDLLNKETAMEKSKKLMDDALFEENPTSYIEKRARQIVNGLKMPNQKKSRKKVIERLEYLWEQAKVLAEEKGMGDKWGYIMRIFQNSQPPEWRATARKA